jgi:hypothetical protein
VAESTAAPSLRTPALRAVTGWNASTEEIVQQYPSLALADVYAVISYYLNERTEVDAYLRQERQRSEQVREQNERQFDLIGVREHLLARGRTAA